MPRPIIAKTFISVTALAVGLGIAAPTPASARDIFSAKQSAPAFIGLQIAQDEDAPALAPQADDAAAAIGEDIAEEAPVNADEPALAPQKEQLNPSDEIKKAVESATGSLGEDKGEGINPSDEIKAAVESATGKVKDDDSGGEEDAENEEEEEEEEEDNDNDEDEDEDEDEKAGKDEKKKKKKKDKNKNKGKNKKKGKKDK